MNVSSTATYQTSHAKASKHHPLRSFEALSTHNSVTFRGVSTAVEKSVFKKLGQHVKSLWARLKGLASKLIEKIKAFFKKTESSASKTEQTGHIPVDDVTPSPHKECSHHDPGDHSHDSSGDDGSMDFHH